MNWRVFGFLWLGLAVAAGWMVLAAFVADTAENAWGIEAGYGTLALTFALPLTLGIAWMERK